MKIFNRTLGVKELLLHLESLQRDRAMPIDIGELIIKKSNDLYFRPILVYISAVDFVQNAPFSQSLSHIYSM